MLFPESFDLFVMGLGQKDNHFTPCWGQALFLLAGGPAASAGLHAIMATLARSRQKKKKKQ